MEEYLSFYNNLNLKSYIFKDWTPRTRKVQSKNVSQRSKKETWKRTPIKFFEIIIFKIKVTKPVMLTNLKFSI